MENSFSIFTSLFCVFGAIIFMFMLFLAASIRVVREGTRLSVYRLGRYLGDKGPGLVLLIPFVDRGVVKDLGAGGKIPSRGLVGVVGETRTTVYTDGQVSLAGGVWELPARLPSRPVSACA